jgi:hypothetical protein
VPEQCTNGHEWRLGRVTVNYVHYTCTKMRQLAVTSGRERAGNYLRSPAQWLMFSLLEAMFTSLSTGGQGQDRTVDLPLMGE